MPSPQKLGPTTVYATWWSATKLSSVRRFSIGRRRLWPPRPMLNRSGRSSTNDSTRSDGRARLVISTDRSTPMRSISSSSSASSRLVNMDSPALK